MPNPMNPMTPMEVQEYAGSLVERYEAMRSLAGDQKLSKIFFGAKLSLSGIKRWSPQTAAGMPEAYAIAEKELFPDLSCS